MEKSSGKRHRRRSHGQVEERVTSKQGHISHSLNSLNYSDSYFFTLSSSSSSSSRKRRKRSFFLFYVAILRFVWILERKNVRLRRHSCVRSMAAKPVHPSRASQLKNTCIICLCVYVRIKSCNLCFLWSDQCFLFEVYEHEEGKWEADTKGLGFEDVEVESSWRESDRGRQSCLYSRFVSESRRRGWLWVLSQGLSFHFHFYFLYAYPGWDKRVRQR